MSTPVNPNPVLASQELGSQPAAPASIDIAELVIKLRKDDLRAGYVTSRAFDLTDKQAFELLRAEFEKREQALREQLAEAVSGRDEWEKTLDEQIKVASDCQSACGDAMLARDKAERELTASRALVSKLKDALKRTVKEASTSLLNDTFWPQIDAALALTEGQVADLLAAKKQRIRHLEECRKSEMAQNIELCADVKRMRAELAKRDAEIAALKSDREGLAARSEERVQEAVAKVREVCDERDAAWAETAELKRQRDDYHKKACEIADQRDAAEAARKRAEAALEKLDVAVRCAVRDIEQGSEPRKIIKLLENAAYTAPARSEEKGAT